MQRGFSNLPPIIIANSELACAVAREVRRKLLFLLSLTEKFG